MKRLLRSCADRLFITIFYNYQTSKFKMDTRPRKILESDFPCNMHIYILCHYYLQRFLKLCAEKKKLKRSCAVKLIRTIFNEDQKSKFKAPLPPKKYAESEFPVKVHIYTLCPYYIQFQENSKFMQRLITELTD